MWDSAIVLARLIECEALPSVGSVEGLKVVELGCGTGAAGLAAAACGARSVVLTDQTGALDVARENARENSAAFGECAVSIVEANWAVEGAVAAAASGCDVCIAADCVYEGEGEAEELIAMFLSALEEAIDTARVPHTIICYKRRRANQQELAGKFLRRCARRFLVDEVTESSLAAEHQGAGLHVLHLRARPRPSKSVCDAVSD